MYEKVLDRVGASVADEVGEAGGAGWVTTGAVVAGGVNPSRA